MGNQISHACFVHDDFAMSYKGRDAEKAFIECVQEYDQAADWRAVSVRDLCVHATQDLSGDDVCSGSAAINEQSYLSLSIPAEACEKAFVMRPWTIPFIMCLCKDTPNIFRLMKDSGRTDIIAERLNQDLRFLPDGKELLLRIVGGKVSGCFGDFNADWTQAEQLTAVRGKLADMFGDHEFIEGVVNHIETHAMYMLGPSIEDANFLRSTHGSDAEAVLAPYLQTWTDAGLDPAILRKAIPTLEFRTGESGLAQVSLIPRIQYEMDGVEVSVLLGPPSKVKHRGRDVWIRFMESLTGIAAAYQNGIRGWVDLTRTEIKHPYNCLSHIMHTGLRASTPAAILSSTLESFALAYPQKSSRKCTAFEIYEAINDMNVRAGKGLTPVKQVQNMEFTCKMLAPKFNWKRFDLTTPASFTRGAVVETEEE